MPNYTYRCKECGCQFEVRLAPEARDSVTVCPSCGLPQLRRVLSLFYVASKGNGDTAVNSSSSCGCRGSCGCGSRHA